MLHPSRIARQSGHTSDPNGRRLGRVFISRSHPHHLTRTQPAFELRRQPELCQQAAGVTIRTAAKWLPMHVSWFWLMQVM
jgi:hypothetical protein